jgi:hypothetical protein
MACALNGADSVRERSWRRRPGRAVGRTETRRPRVAGSMVPSGRPWMCRCRLDAVEEAPRPERDRVAIAGLPPPRTEIGDRVAVATADDLHTGHLH